MSGAGHMLCILLQFGIITKSKNNMQKHSVSKRIHSGPILLRYFFFVAGVAATIAYRITPFLTPIQVKIAWYVGTIGFILYFWHRAHIEAKRANLVKDYNL